VIGQAHGQAFERRDIAVGDKAVTPVADTLLFARSRPFKQWFMIPFSSPHFLPATHIPSPKS
jgi:hypothetical protein